MKRMIWFLLLAFPLSGWTQHQGNIWYFGQGAGIKFTDSGPVLLANGAIETTEGCASICDSGGNLLFYTNGGGRLPGAPGSTGMIWNSDHAVMYDMEGMEGGGFGAAQSSVIVPMPGSDTNYYLFTMEEIEFDIDGMIPSQPLGRGLSYFIIDMELNNGLGGVSQSGQQIFSPAYESLSAVLHENGTDYWIFAINNLTGAYLRVLITGEGIQSLDFQIPDFGVLPGGVIKFSPDRTWMYNAGFLYDFDAENGLLGNPVNLMSSAYSASFSPNSEYFYSVIQQVDQAVVMQFDLTVANPATSGKSIGSIPTNNVGQMQLTPDGRIFVLTESLDGSEMQLHAIDCPNTDFPSVDLDLFSFPLDDADPFLGLPNFTDHLFEFEEAVFVDLGPDSTHLCAGETLELNAETTGASYLWSTGANTPSIEVTAPGTYEVTITIGCGVGTDAIRVDVIDEIEELEIIGSEVICPDEELMLGLNQTDFTDFQWSDGSSAAELLINSGGVFGVTVTDVCGHVASAEKEVTQLSLPLIQIDGDLSLCRGERTQLIPVVENAYDYFWWSDQDVEILDVEVPGLYQLQADNECGTSIFEVEVEQVDCDQCLLMPSAFSPNSDGLNDTFGPIVKCDLADYTLQVYSRWGQLIYSSQNPEEGWDGHFEGDLMTSDVYVWMLRYRVAGREREEMQSGDLTLLR